MGACHLVYMEIPNFPYPLLALWISFAFKNFFLQNWLYPTFVWMDLSSSHPQIFLRTVQYHPCWSPSLLVSPGWCHSSLPPSSSSSPLPSLLSIVSSLSLLLTTVFMCLTHSSLWAFAPSILQVSSLLTLPQAFICFPLPSQPSISLRPSASFPLVSAKAQLNDIHVYDTVNCVFGHQWRWGVPIHMLTANLIWTITYSQGTSITITCVVQSLTFETKVEFFF